MRNPGFNCRHNSAWHAWQVAGHDWRKNNPNATRDETENAARQFAAVESAELAQSARYRAFMECAA